MGRLFELLRPWRTLLAVAVVFGSGLISYATVLNPHAPAAALVLSSAACLIHVTLAGRTARAAVWLALAGLSAALAAAIDPPAAVFLILFLLVVLVMRWPLSRRVGGMLVYALGALGPLALHGALTSAATGDLLQGSGFGVSGPTLSAAAFGPESLSVPAATDASFFDDEVPARTAWQSVGHSLLRLVNALVGEHGVFSHFPVVVLGVLGVTMVMHRHWPATTKTLASVTAGGAAAVVLLYAIRWLNWREAMFASRWFVVFLPLLLFWCGAWLRRRHRPASWAMAGSLLAFSIIVSLLGATGPLPRDGFRSYTAAGAAKNLIAPPPPAEDPWEMEAVAGVDR
jgi:hypothetical protein